MPYHQYNVNDTFGMEFKSSLGENMYAEKKDDGVFEPVGPFEAKWSGKSTGDLIDEIEAAYDGETYAADDIGGARAYPLSVSPGKIPDSPKSF